MQFRECLNCEYLSCTLQKVCILSPEDPGPNWVSGQFPPLPPPPDTDEREQPPEPPCTAQFSSNGLCPCCGVVVERDFYDQTEQALFDQCMSCGWESEPFYDW